jgi:hypothetical protein
MENAGPSETEVVDMGLDRKQHQGLFGETFVEVLASAAGLLASRPRLDVTGEDFTICHKGAHGGKRHPRIDVQVKSWKKSRADASWYGNGWKYRMNVRQFNELADPQFTLPRFLFVVIVPDNATQYTMSEAGKLVLFHSAYWASFNHLSVVDPADQATIAVDIPATNLLTVDSLLALVSPTSERES